MTNKAENLEPPKNGKVTIPRVCATCESYEDTYAKNPNCYPYCIRENGPNFPIELSEYYYCCDKYKFNNDLKSYRSKSFALMVFVNSVLTQL